MNVRTGLQWGVVLVSLMYAASPAGAQLGQAGSDSRRGGGDSQLTVTAPSAQLTPQQELVEAELITVRMDASASSVRRQLEAARAQRDVVKTLCLNDKLSQIDVAIRSARERKMALQTAANRNDVELSNHEFTILTVLRQRLEQLSNEASQCIGEDSSAASGGGGGGTRVVTAVDPYTASFQNAGAVSPVVAAAAVADVTSLTNISSLPSQVSPVQ